MEIPCHLALTQEVVEKRAKVTSMVESLQSASSVVEACSQSVGRLNAPPLCLNVSMDHLTPTDVQILSEAPYEKVVLQKLLQVMNDRLLALLEHSRTTGLPDVAPLLDRLRSVADTFSKQSTECTRQQIRVATRLEDIVNNLNKLLPTLVDTQSHASPHYGEGSTRQLLCNDGLFSAGSPIFGRLPLDTSVVESPTPAQGPGNLLPQVSRSGWVLNPKCEGDFKPWLDSESYDTPPGERMSCKKQATTIGKARIHPSSSKIPVVRSSHPERGITRHLFPPQGNSTRLGLGQENSLVPIEWSSIEDDELPSMWTPLNRQETLELSKNDTDQVFEELFSPITSSPLKSYLDNVASVGETMEGDSHILDFPSNVSVPKPSVASTSTCKKPRKSLENLIQRYSRIKKKMIENEENEKLNDTARGCFTSK